MIRPSSVSSTERLDRRKIWMPISSSSRRICWEIADWARNSSSAAFVKERWRATATIVRRCRSSMHPWCGGGGEKSKSRSGSHPSRSVMDRQQPRDRLRLRRILERRDLDADEASVVREARERVADLVEPQPAADRELDGHDRRIDPVAVEMDVHGALVRHAGPHTGLLDLDALPRIEVA